MDLRRNPVWNRQHVSQTKNWHKQSPGTTHGTWEHWNQKRSQHQQKTRWQGIKHRPTSYRSSFLRDSPTCEVEPQSRRS